MNVAQAAFLLFLMSSISWAEESGVQLDTRSASVLQVPRLSNGPPAAGRRVAVTPPEYRDTQVFHTLYLPELWETKGPALPIIFEYTGNFFPASGSTGEPEDASLGFCLSGGKYIWVALPYVNHEGRDNEVTWWGDAAATVNYAKQNVPRIIKEYGADTRAVFLCGFSRGAIGVNYLGLHDDEIAKLWTAFITHDHYDGVREWRGTTWGTPLDQYRQGARQRLRRVRQRPYLVCQNGGKYGADEFIRSVLSSTDHFTFLTISASEILGEFPNQFAKTGHTDRWAMKPSRERTKAWEWMNSVTRRGRGSRSQP